MPPSLERLDLKEAPGASQPHEGNTTKFTGGIPTEWSSLTNLKELSMADCGLSGA